MFSFSLSTHAAKNSGHAKGETGLLPNDLQRLASLKKRPVTGEGRTSPAGRFRAHSETPIANGGRSRPGKDNERGARSTEAFELRDRAGVVGRWAPVVSVTLGERCDAAIDGQAGSED